MNWHLVKLFAMKIKCKRFVIPLSIFSKCLYRYLSLFVKMANYHDKKDPSVSQESSNNDDDFEGLKKDVESLETTIKFPKNRKATGDDNVTD